MDPKRILMIVLVCAGLVVSNVAFAQSSGGPASSEPTSQIAAPSAASDTTPSSQPTSRSSPYRQRGMAPRPVIAVAPDSQPVPETTTASATTTAPTVEPAEPTSAPASAVPTPADAARNIRLQFKNASPMAIVEWMCEKMHRNLLGEVQIPGLITIYDSEPYTVTEAFDTVNVLLAMRGFRVVEEGRFLRVVPLTEIITSVKGIPIYQGMDKTAGSRDGELATVLMPLKYMDPVETAKLMARMASLAGAVSPMPTGKGLLITDNMGNIRRISDMIKLMDNSAVSVDRQVKVIELKQAPARDVAQIITGLWGPGNVARKMNWNDQAKRMDPVPPDPAEIIIAQPYEQTNTLVLMGEAGRLLTAEQMVKDLDNKSGPNDRDMRIFMLKNAKADDLAETIRQSLPAPRPSKFGPAEQARVAADAATNRLIVSAPVDQMAQIEKLIKELDEAVTMGGGNRIFRLQASDAQQIANVINMAMQKRDPRGRVTMPLSVSVEPRSNSVILAGPQGDINTAAQLIKELDVVEKEPRDIRVVPLKAGDARQVAQSLMNVMSQPGGQGPRPTAGGLRVEADPVSNSLIISASPGDWPTIERFLKQLEEAVPQMTAVTRMVPLQHATATELAGTLQQIYAARANRNRPGPGTIAVSIAASDRANSLLISASQDDQESIAGLISQMDVETKEKIDPIVMIELKTADANKLADMLRSMVPPPQGARSQPISIMADPSGAAILIRAPEAQRKMIEEMIAKLDKDSGSASFVRETQVLPLKTASATQMVATLNQVFNQQPTMLQRGQTSNASERIIITAAPGDKALVIDAPKKKLEDIIQLATTLDVPDSAQDPVVMIDLKAADANQLVTTLRSLLPAPTRGNEVFLSADTLTNTVLIRAPASQRQMLQDMIAKLDTANVESARERRVHPLKTASANAMVPMLNQLFIQQPAGRTARTPDVSERIIIAPAPGDKALVIDAPKKKIEEIIQLVDTLDVGEVAAGQLQMRTYILNSANAVELARSLTALFAEQLRAGQGQTPSNEPQPRFQAEANSNQLLVAATTTQFETIDKLIEKMEKDGGGVKSEARFFEFKHAQASAILPMVRSVVEADIRSLERLSPSRRRADFQVSADDRTNTLIVTAPIDTLDMLAKLLAKVDSGEVEAMTTQVVALENADANELANTLNSALSSVPGGTPSPAMRSLPQATQGLAGRKISVIANVSSRALVLTGNKVDIEFALGIIKELDGRESVTTPIVQTYKIANGKAETIARVLNESLVRGQPAAPRGQAARPPIQIIADADSNSLVVSAGADVQKTVVEILKQLDTAEAAGSAVTVELVKLEFAKADQMATALNAAASGNTPGAARRTDQQVVVTADVGSNSLLLTGRPQDIATKKKLVEDLDKASAQGIIKLKVLPLKVAKASEMVELLQSMLSDPGAYAPRQRTPQASTPTPVRVAAQTHTNSIVIQGPAEAIALAEELVAKFDVSSEGNEVSIQIIQLVNAQAASLAEAVNANIQAQATAGGRGAPRPATAKPGEDTVTVTPEPNSNSVLIRGPAKEVPAVVEMIKKLDATGTSGSAQVRTYKVVNNDAEELAATLGKLFQDMIRQMRPANGMQPVPFTIGADLRTNTLVVSTTPSYFTMFENLFKQLDASDAQAMYKDVQYIKLYNADAFDVAARLNSLFLGVKGPDKPIIEADYVDNSLSIIAKDLDYRMMEPIISKMDKAVRVDVRVFPVVSLKADKLVAALQQIWPQMSDAELRVVAQLPARGETNGNATSQPGNGAHVEPIQQNGTNILPADDTVLAGTHTQQAPPATQATASQATTSQPTTKAAVAIATGALDDLLPENEAARQPVVIAIDKATNSLIVSATRQDMDMVQSLINQLVISGPASEAEIRWFTIKNTDPESVAIALESLFNPKPQGQQGQPGQPANARGGARGARGGAAAGQPGQPQPQPAQPGQPGQPQAQPQPQPTAAPTITVFADSRTQQLGVRAKPMDFDLIIPVIEQLDRVSGGPITEVRTFPLKNTDATEVAANLRELFRLAGVPAGGQAGRRTPQQRQAGVLRRSGAAGPDATAPAAPAAPDAAPAAPDGQADAAELDGSTTVSISANRATNTVIISAPADAMQVLASLIEELEQSGVGTSKPVVRLYSIKNADVNDIAAMVQQIFVTGAAQGARGPGRAAAAAAELPVIVTADEVGKLVIVSASVDKHELIKQVIEDVEKAQGDTGAVEVKVYKIVNSNAQSVANVLTSTLSQSASGASGAAARPRGGRGAAGAATGTSNAALRISADPTSNCIVVSATTEEHKQIEALLKDIDSKPGSDFEVRMIALKNADATSTAQTLSRIFIQGQTQRSGTQSQPAIVIEANAESRTIMVRADDETFKKIDELVQKLDQTGASNKVYILPLEKSRAADMAVKVNDLYRQMQQSSKGKTLEPMAVTADERSNSLVIASSELQFKEVSEWVDQLEQMGPPRTSPRVIQLENADPAEVQKAIDQLFGGSAPPRTPARPAAGARPTGATAGRPAGATTARPATGGATGGSTVSTAGGVTTTVLSSARQLLVDASDEDFAAIQQLAKTLDEAAKVAKADVQIFQLKNADNARVAASLTTVMGRLAQAGRPEDQVSVTALPQTKAVVVTASKEKMVTVAKLIEQLDKEEISTPIDFKVYALENASPTEVLPQINQMITSLKQFEPTLVVNVTADERTRSIIIAAQTSTFAKIDPILKAVDAKPAHKEGQVLVIPLKRADATRLAEVLNEMLRPSATAAVTAEARALQQQVKLLQVARAGGDPLPDLDLTKPIKINSDPSASGAQGSNSLIITSTAENLKALQAIVELMDTVPIGEAVKVQLVHLEHADATAVMTTLREIFTQGQTNLAGKLRTSVAGRAEPDSVSGKALTNSLNISADLRTNTLVLSGVAESLALAELIVKDMDRDDAKFTTEVRLFKLANADATRLMPVLQAVFAEQATAGGAGAGAGAAGAAGGADGIRTYATRLQTVLDKNQGNATEWPKTRPALTIQADATTNTLVVAARTDIMPLIADVIKTMDIPGAGSLNTVRIFPLVNADATRLQTVINSLFTGPNAQFVRNEDKPTIAVDTRANSLVISASDKTFAMLDALLKKMDDKTPMDLRDMRLLPLKNADSATLSASLQRLMDARVARLASISPADADRLKVTIIADARSNNLMISGSPESYDLIKGLAEQLDGASPALSGDIQIFMLKEANAGTLSTTLQNLFTQRYAAAQTPDVARQKPIILADLRVNCLLVAANQDDSRVLASLLSKLDVKQTDPAVQLVVIPLQHNDCGVVGPMLTTLFAARLTQTTLPGAQVQPQDRVTVSTDGLSNSLIVSASKENIELINGLLGKLDVEPPTESGLVRLYPLKNADASRVATMLQGLVSQGLYKPGAAAATGNAAMTAREKVAFAVDTRTNVLIVSASKENFAVLEEIINKVDDSDAYSLLSDIRIFTLVRADASRLAPTLQQFFTAKRAGEVQTGDTGKSLPVTIVPDPRTNTLLVAGSKESFGAVEEMVKKLDGESVVQSTEFKVFTLKQGTAVALQPIVQQLMAQRVKNASLPLDPVTVMADGLSNTLIVGASPADMQLVDTLVARLDVPAVSGEQVRVFPLRYASATLLVTTLRTLTQPATGGGAGAVTASTLKISADERINAVIVTGGQADMERVASMIEQIDKKNDLRVMEVRVFTLQHADATDLATLLTATLTRKPTPVTPSENPNQQNIIQFITQSPEGKQLITSAVQEGLLITAQRSGNALVVTAPMDSMPLLKSLIEALDSVRLPKAEIRYFTLRNADATRMAETLRELFRMSATGGATAGTATQNYTLSTSQPADGSDPASATMGTADQTALTITVDGRTNTLLISGTIEYIELCSKIVTELDAQPQQDRLSAVYRLRNARAKDVQTAMQTWLDTERQRITTSLGTTNIGAAQQMLDREVGIVAVPSVTETGTDVSNTLLIWASPRYFEQIKTIVDELDQPPPQVLIQVLLAEVTLDDTTSLGLDWNLKSDFGNSTLNVGTNFGMVAPTNALNVSVTGGDLTMFLRALQTQGRVEVLSRPQIMASDNQAAEVNVGKRVPFVQSTQLTSQGIPVNTVDYKDVGIILRVTPRINPDGFIRMQVNPEISSIDPSPLQLSDNINAIVINNRSAQTTVTVQDGHTIVIGGLITTSNKLRESKVPILGDIPGLGLLFKSSKVEKERTELLIFLTPQVIRTVPQADVATNKELRRMDISPRMERAVDLESLFNPLEGLSPAELERLNNGRGAERKVTSGAVVVPSPNAFAKPQAPEVILTAPNGGSK